MVTNQKRQAYILALQALWENPIIEPNAEQIQAVCPQLTLEEIKTKMQQIDEKSYPAVYFMAPRAFDIRVFYMVIFGYSKESEKPMLQLGLACRYSFSKKAKYSPEIKKALLYSHKEWGGLLQDGDHIEQGQFNVEYLTGPPLAYKNNNNLEGL